jgi:hypothetical protein
MFIEYTYEASMAEVRMSVVVTEEVFNELKTLMDECGIDTQKDLFNSSITLFRWAVREIKRGRGIASIDEAARQVTEFSMPPFEHLRARTAPSRQASATHSN